MRHPTSARVGRGSTGDGGNGGKGFALRSRRPARSHPGTFELASLRRAVTGVVPSGRGLFGLRPAGSRSLDRAPRPPGASMRKAGGPGGTSKSLDAFELTTRKQQKSRPAPGARGKDAPAASSPPIPADAQARPRQPRSGPTFLSRLCLCAFVPSLENRVPRRPKYRRERPTGCNALPDADASGASPSGDVPGLFGEKAQRHEA